MSVGQMKKTGVWYCQYRVAGRKSPVKEYFGKGEEGKKAAKLRDLDVKKSKVEKRAVHRDEMTLTDLAKEYVAQEKAKGRSLDYLRFIAAKVNNDWHPILDGKPISQLKAKDFLAVHALYADNSVATQNRYMDYLNIIFNFGVRMEYIDKNPMKTWWAEMKQPEQPRNLDHFRLEDFRKLYEVSPPHLKWTLDIMWELGARPGPSELFGLKWKDIDWARNTIRVRGTKTRSSDRIIPITDEFKERLKSKRDEAQTDYLIEYKGKRVKSVKTAFNSAKKRAGLDASVCMYTIRHLFASEALTNGADAKAMANLLGHTSLRMIMGTYYHEIEGEKRNAIQRKPRLIT
ncbi:tyrosine-type recombinase/integrase [Desulfovibrio caledoniensis]